MLFRSNYDRIEMTKNDININKKKPNMEDDEEEKKEEEKKDENDDSKYTEPGNIEEDYEELELDTKLKVYNYLDDIKKKGYHYILLKTILKLCGYKVRFYKSNLDEISLSELLFNDEDFKMIASSFFNILDDIDLSKIYPLDDEELHFNNEGNILNEERINYAFSKDNSIVNPYITKNMKKREVFFKGMHRSVARNFLKEYAMEFINTRNNQFTFLIENNTAYNAKIKLDKKSILLLNNYDNFMSIIRGNIKDSPFFNKLLASLNATISSLNISKNAAYYKKYEITSFFSYSRIQPQYNNTIDKSLYMIEEPFTKHVNDILLLIEKLIEVLTSPFNGYGVLVEGSNIVFEGISEVIIEIQVASNENENQINIEEINNTINNI